LSPPRDPPDMPFDLVEFSHLPLFALLIAGRLQALILLVVSRQRYRQSILKHSRGKDAWERALPRGG
jgi:hypothetical protein